MKAIRLEGVEGDTTAILQIVFWKIGILLQCILSNLFARFFADS